MIYELIWLFAFLLAFSIGANDAANGLGTSYGAKTMPLVWIMIMGAVAEFLGAMFFSNAVATTLSDNIVHDLDTLDK